MTKLTNPKYKRNVDEAQRLFNEVSNEVYELGGKLLADIDKVYETQKDELRAQFARMIFRLGYEFFKAGRTEAEQRNIVGQASAIRSGIENTANLKFILGRSEKDFIRRATSYVNSYRAYDEGIVKLAAEVKLAVKNRDLKEINPWTSSSITDRVRGENEAVLSIYDWMSHFAHPNPGILNYFWKYEVLDFHCEMFSAHNSAAFLTLIQRLASIIEIDSSNVLATKVYFRKISDAFELLSFIGAEETPMVKTDDKESNAAK